MSLKCPVCKNVLKAVQYEGVRVQFCMPCKGFFLKPNELKRIQETQEVEVSMDMAPPSRSGDKVTRFCPSCDLAMAKKKHGKVSSTIIDICEACNGIWVDKGELQRIQLDYEVVERNRSVVKAKPKTPGAIKPTASVSAFKCPKCSHEQKKAEECIKCGIVFAKFNAAQGPGSAAQGLGQNNNDEIAGIAKNEKKTKKVGWLASTFFTQEAAEDLYRDKGSKKKTKRKTKKIEWVILIIGIFFLLTYQFNCQPQRETTGHKSKAQALTEAFRNDTCF